MSVFVAVETIRFPWVKVLDRDDLRPRAAAVQCGPIGEWPGPDPQQSKPYAHPNVTLSGSTSRGSDVGRAVGKERVLPSVLTRWMPSHSLHKEQNV